MAGGCILWRWRNRVVRGRLGGGGGRLLRVHRSRLGKESHNVLPLLRRDRLVGRADLKHDRTERTLTVKSFHREPGVRGALDDALDAALARLARVLGAERVVRS